MRTEENASRVNLFHPALKKSSFRLDVIYIPETSKETVKWKLSII